MIKKLNLFAAFIFLNLVMVSCGSAADTEAAEEDSTLYNMVNENDSTQWVRLFDGQTLNGWHGFNKTAKVDNWMIEDSALVCLGAAIGDTGGDLVSENEYGNFELVWDWKMTKGGNSGVMYHVVEDAKYKAPYETGPEYQMIDDDNFEDPLENWQKTGANYAMHVPNNLKKVKPLGEWNSSRIIFNNGHVEHWLNGEKIVEFEAWTDAWEKEKTTGKWKDFPDYGSAKKGKIALQDHGHKVYFKNIKIREL